jgi:hypothetical protein
MLLMRKVQLHCQLGTSREGPRLWNTIFIRSLQDLEPESVDTPFFFIWRPSKRGRFKVCPFRKLIEGH